MGKAKIPGKFTSRFRTSVQSNSKDLTAKPGAQNNCFLVAKLPALPLLADELKALMLKFEILSTYLIAKPKKRPKKRTKEFRKINAFIAYRSFYTTAVTDAKLQRDLSVMLAETWKNERRKDVWQMYAASYNETAARETSILGFVDWLCERLNLRFPEEEATSSASAETHVENTTVFASEWPFATTRKTNMVEDIFVRPEGTSSGDPICENDISDPHKPNAVIENFSAENAAAPHSFAAPLLANAAAPNSYSVNSFLANSVVQCPDESLFRYHQSAPMINEITMPVSEPEKPHFWGACGYPL